MTEHPSVTSIQLKEREPTVINFNRPVKFRIDFVRGTYMEGIIPPNSGFTVCNHGDIAKFSITIDDDSVRKPGLVEPSAGNVEGKDDTPAGD